MTITRGQALAVALLAAGGVAVYVIALKPPPAPEELIRQRVVQMVSAAQDKDIGFVLQQVSARFKSDEGWGKDELRGILVQQILRGEWVRIFLVDVETSSLSARSVRVSVKLLFARSQAKTVKDLAKDSVVGAYAIDAQADQESDGEWRFVSAKVQAVDGAQLL